MQRREGKWKEKVRIVGNILRLVTSDFFHFQQILQAPRKTDLAEPFFSCVKGFKPVTTIEKHLIIMNIILRTL